MVLKQCLLVSSNGIFNTLHYLMNRLYKFRVCIKRPCEYIYSYPDPHFDQKNSATPIVANNYFNIFRQNRHPLKEIKKDPLLTVWVSVHWLENVPLNSSHDQFRPRSI